jgi:V8-like Glu-specific endopeptidase
MENRKGILPYSAILILLMANLFLKGQDYFNPDFKNEKAFKEFLITNISALDKIEGIWKMSYEHESYLLDPYGKKLLPMSLSTDFRWVIYKKNGRYKAFCSEIIYIWKEGGSKGLGYLEYSFERTAEDGRYLYQVIDGGEHKEDYAFVGNGKLNISRTENENLHGSLKVTKMKISGIKLSPNIDDYNAVRQDEIQPKTPDNVSGTGFAIGNSGYIVTAHHVVDGMNFISIKDLRDGGSKNYSCVVVERNKNSDLAILKIVDDNFKGFQNIPYSFRSNKVQVGEDVFTLGYPLKSTMGEEIKLTNGIISANSGFGGDTTLLQVSVPVQPGNSGGPLIDRNGNLVGVMNAKYANAENASYAIKVIELKKLLQRIPISSLPNVSLMASNDLPTKVSAMKNYVFIIEARK